MDATASTKVGDPATSAGPKWLVDLIRLLSIRSQFVLSGNIRDAFLAPSSEGLVLLPLLDCLWDALKDKGYEFFLVYDKVDGARVYPNDPVFQDMATRGLGVALKNGYMSASPDKMLPFLKTAASSRTVGAGAAEPIRCAVIIDYASRLSASPQAPAEAEFKFFSACEKLAESAAPIMPKGSKGLPTFNPVIWLLNRENDLPSWFTMDNPRVHTQTIAMPGYEERMLAGNSLAAAFLGFDIATQPEKEKFAKTFADHTDGMTLRSLIDITQLARNQEIPFSGVEDAVRCYKVGAIDNPWRKQSLRDKIRSADDSVSERVKGQRQAVTKTVDILKRSVMGLTGAQARSGSGRPRGVLFFAGPTGVGKTELAKAITETIFGDERSYIRFDMSEFAAEHADARLLGAPPGYVGYDAGGELTNSVKQKPFSVILFDEIEKAHPRILDKFLQILEDGRLTDGRGDTVYFSESIIVFTSNLGIYIEDEHGGRVQNVRPGDSYEEVEKKVREAIERYFKFTLSRPEILNRIGDNIVVFNFIVPEVAVKIFEGMLNNILRRVREEHKLTLNISDSVRANLLKWCTSDLSNGGRGIGNRLETTFINPLGRALFLQNLDGKKELVVKDVTVNDNVYSVVLA